MSLKIETEDKSMAGESKRFKPGERMYLNAAGDRLVEEGDPDAAFLWCSEHHTVSRTEFSRLMGEKESVEELDNEPSVEPKKEPAGKTLKEKLLGKDNKKN